MTTSPMLATAVLDAAEAIARGGTVYLLHFDRPYRHAAHYTGWTTNLAHRLDEHETGHGARLLAVIKAAGIGWQLARIWPGTRTTERALKRQGGASRRCPICVLSRRTNGGAA
jgi:predicted GIY-YIG superfamily endonuclease